MKSLFKSIRKWSSIRDKLKDGPTLKDFMMQEPGEVSAIDLAKQTGLFDDPSILANKRFSLKTFGCQMNSNDSEIIETILKDKQMVKLEDYNDSDIVLINTCAIRENAEQKIWSQVNQIRHIKEARQKKERSSLLVFWDAWLSD